MNFKEISARLSAKKSKVGGIKTLIGFDGTVDKIVAVVDKRLGLGENYTPIKTIKVFGEKIVAAAGKSMNLEPFLKQQKIGGNATIMSGALAASGTKTTLIADLGAPKIHPVFEELEKKATLISLGEPTETHALEFSDGKIMLCYTRNHEAITFERVVKTFASEKGFWNAFDNADLVAFVNWTMIPGMTGIFKKTLALLTKNKISQQKPEGLIFFDLADPQKRPVKELKEALLLIGKFSKFKKTVLGVNLKEAQQVADVLELGKIVENKAGMEKAAAKIRTRLNLDVLVIHTVKTATCAVKVEKDISEVLHVNGPYTPTPKLTTGAGDNFNAGFTLGLALGVTAQEALVLAVATSGSYVRTGISPKFSDVLAFIKKGW